MEKKILVVEDEDGIRELLETIFTKAGYIPILAESAEEALEILKIDRINVFFIDLNLPGINGVELCRRIRKNNPIACIYSMTGYSTLFELADCREAGFDDYFQKPIDNDIFLDSAKLAFEKLTRWTKQ